MGAHGLADDGRAGKPAPPDDEAVTFPIRVTVRRLPFRNEGVSSDSSRTKGMPRTLYGS